MQADENSNIPKEIFVSTIGSLISECELSQAQIARRLGYDNQNIITMFKRGTTRIPAEKVAPLAEILGVDPGDLVRQWLRAYMPHFLPHLDRYLVPASHATS
jgi:transcriptional regulator with XRE-family HTH domain